MLACVNTFVKNTTNVIFWGDWNDGELANEFANPYPSEGTLSKTGSDIIFNTDFNSDWYFGSSAPGSRNGSQIDFADVLIHELGHTLGLDHSSYTTVIMSGALWSNWTVSPLRTLAGGDVAGAIHQHPTSYIYGTFSHDIVLSSHAVSSAVSKK